MTVRPIDDAKLEEIADSLAADEEQLILALDATPGLSQAKIAEALGWMTGKDNKAPTSRRSTARSPGSSH